MYEQISLTFSLVMICINCRYSIFPSIPHWTTLQNQTKQNPTNPLINQYAFISSFNSLTTASSVGLPISTSPPLVAYLPTSFSFTSQKYVSPLVSIVSIAREGVHIHHSSAILQQLPLVRSLLILGWEWECLTRLTKPASLGEPLDFHRRIIRCWISKVVFVVLMCVVSHGQDVIIFNY